MEAVSIFSNKPDPYTADMMHKKTVYAHGTNNHSKLCFRSLEIFRESVKFNLGGLFRSTIHKTDRETLFCQDKPARNTSARTRLSKELIKNLINPEIAKTQDGVGSPPDLSIGERQLFQVLLHKIDAMHAEELRIKYLLLGIEQENPKEDGFLVVASRKDVLVKAYGELSFSGKHYSALEQGLNDLLKKSRTILIKTRKQTILFSGELLRHTKYPIVKEWEEFLIYSIPYEIAKLHDEKYSSYPANYFALLRTAVPRTSLHKTEMRFFDFIRNEAPHKISENKEVRRRKNLFLQLIGGLPIIEYRHKKRLAQRIETIYFPKAIHLNFLSGWSTEINRQGEEVYVFYYAPQRT